MKLSELNRNLSDLFSTSDYEENGGIHITGADWLKDDLKLKLSIRTGVNNEYQLWEAHISGVREELIKADWVDELSILRDHPLLWKYNDLQAELYFSRSTDRPFELLNSILETHYEVTEGWCALDEFINGNSLIPLIELCKPSNALLARGPKKLLMKYSKVLDAYMMKPNLFGERKPKRWTGKRWIDENRTLSVLLIGKSYVVAETFDFERK